MMIYKYLAKYLHLVFSVIIVFVSAFLFYQMIHGNIPSDFTAHITKAQQFIKGKIGLPTYGGLYLLVSLFTGFTPDLSTVRLAFGVILIFSILFKFYLSIFYLRPQKYELKNEDSTITLITVLAFLTLLCFHLPHPNHLLNNQMYASYQVGHVWHNPTIIFSIPFAMMVYFSALNLINNYSYKNIVILSILILICNYSKPSFFLCFCLSYPIMIFLEYKLSRRFWISCTPVIVGLIFLYFQYKSVYQSPSGTTTGIEIDLFKHWKSLIFRQQLLVLNTAISLIIITLLSIAFPITILLFNLIRIKKDLLFALLLFLTSLFIYILFRETGSRSSHGNFGWQRVPATYILFLVSVKYYIEMIRNDKIQRWKKITVTILLLAHAAQGAAYYDFILKHKNYYNRYLVKK